MQYSGFGCSATKARCDIETKKRGSLIVHIGVFDVLNKVLLQKLSGDASKNTIILQFF